MDQNTAIFVLLLHPTTAAIHKEITKNLQCKNVCRNCG